MQAQMTLTLVSTMFQTATWLTDPVCCGVSASTDVIKDWALWLTGWVCRIHDKEGSVAHTGHDAGTASSVSRGSTPSSWCYSQAARKEYGYQSQLFAPIELQAPNDRQGQEQDEEVSHHPRQRHENETEMVVPALVRNGGIPIGCYRPAEESI